MQIKKLFDDLKRFGNKDYYNRNGEEEIRFCSGGSGIEIYRVGNLIDIVINDCGERNNYLDSETLTTQQKKQIATILQSCTSLEDKCNNVCAILVDVFCQKKN